MGGIFPEGGEECNVSSDPEISKYAIENWPGPILFSGYKLGAKINSGMRLPYLSNPNPIKRAFEIASCSGCVNTSFDQAAVLAAVRNPELYWDIISNGYTTMSANPEIGNQWHISANKNHAYLVEKVPSRQMEDTIEDMMMDLPHAKKQSFFTLPLDNTIRLVQGTAFGYRMPYYSFNSKDIEIRFKYLPNWISYEKDSIFGMAPASQTSYQFQAVIFDSGEPIDTAEVTVSIMEKQPLITGIRSVTNDYNIFRIAKIKMGNRIYTDRSFTLKSIPDKYLTYSWICGPANDGHRYDLGDAFITFTANEEVNVSIGYDNDYLQLMPDWLKV